MFCRAQLERFEKRRAELEKAGARIAAVCVDPVEKSQALAKRLGLGFPIVADPTGDMIRAYGVWHAQPQIALPTVFVIGRDGRIAWRKVAETLTDRPAEDEVLAAVSKLGR